MELDQILDRFAEGLVAVDFSTTHISSNQRTGEIYLPGVKTLREPKFVEELVNWWKTTYPNDFMPEGAIEREVPYPDVVRASCDLTFSSDGSPLQTPEWAIEVKHIALVGNNGKNNDYGVQKILSPYLKDRSLIHDINRMRLHPMGRRQAVIGYCFEYNFETYEEAIAHHIENHEYIDNVREVCRKNDPATGSLSVIPMVEFADEIFASKGIVEPMIYKSFEGAWRHPCGGRGHIFGWEVKPN